MEVALSNSRPLITFRIITFNQERYIREAVEGALRQTYTPLEIQVSDDASTDRTFEIIKAIANGYRGPHRLRLNRNERNLGITGHINRAFELSSGELTVCADGDDVSLPERTESLWKKWRENPRCHCIHSATAMMDAEGRIVTPKKARDMVQGDVESAIAAAGTTVQGASNAFTRANFDKFGPLPLSVRSEDKVLSFRSLLLGGIAYVDAPLVRYRVHGGNVTLKHVSPYSFKEYVGRQNWKYSEQLAYYAAFRRDVEVAADLGIIPREDAVRYLNLIDRETAMRHAYLDFLKGTPLDRLRMRRRIPQFEKILGKEKNRRLVHGAMVPGLVSLAMLWMRIRDRHRLMNSRAEAH